MRMQPPGETAELGYLLGLEHMRADGVMVTHVFGDETYSVYETESSLQGPPKVTESEFLTAGPPLLFWSEAQQSAYAFTDLVDISARERLPRGQHSLGREMYEMWTGGPASDVVKVSVPAPNMSPRGRGLRILYHSDKWGPWTTYVHDHDPGTTVSIGPGQIPSVLQIQGPPLRLTYRGLVG